MNSFLRKGLLLPLAAATLLITACGSKPAQPATEKSLSVNPSSLSLSDASSTETVTVTAEGDWGVSVSDRDWLSVSPSGGVAGTTPVTVKIAENKTYDTRTGSITFRYGGKKLAFSYLKTSHQDVLCLIDDTVEGRVLKVDNCTLTPVEGEVKVSDVASGRTLWKGGFRAEANTATAIAPVDPGAGQGVLLIEYTVDGVRRVNHYLYGEPPFRLADYRK